MVPAALGKRLKSAGASRLVASGSEGLMGSRPVKEALLMPMLLSEKVPVLLVSSKPCGYLSSVAGP